MRNITERESDLLLGSQFKQRFRVYIENAEGEMVEFTERDGEKWVEYIEINSDIDSPVKDFNIEITRNKDRTSLSTLMKDSIYNNEDGGIVDSEFKPAINLVRKFKIETAIAEIGESIDESYWKTFEEGYIDVINLENNPIILRCRGKGAYLEDKHIEEERAYGSESGVPVETVMNNILQDNDRGDVDLKVPESPGWAITEYRQRKESVLSALNELAQQIGWEVRYKYYNPTDSIELVFYEPDRDPESIDWIFTPGDYIDVNDLTLDISEIRNKVRVVYSDFEKEDEDGNPGKRVSIEDEDLDSINEYGVRFMEISEASNSQINTEPEAQRLLDSALHDLKDPKATQEIETVLFFPVQLHDFYEFEPNGVHYDREQNFGVVGYRHQINLKDHESRTYINTTGRPNMSETGRPIGQHIQWHRREARPGLARENRFFPPRPPINLTTSSSIDGIQLRFSAELGDNVSGYNVYCSDIRDFEPSSDSKIASGQSNSWNINSYYDSNSEKIQIMQPEETYFIKVKSYDERRNLSDSSEAVSGIYVGRDSFTHNESPLDMSSGNLEQVVVTFEGLILEYENSEEEKYYESGYRETNAFDISRVQEVQGSGVFWEKEIPSNTDIEVEASLDGSSWSACTNGGSIPVLSEGQDVSDDNLYFRFTLTTSDIEVTPILEHFNFYIATTTTLIEGGVTEDNIADGAVTPPKLAEDYTKSSEFNSHKGSRGTDEHDIATDVEAGFMSSSDKEKLDGVEDNANDYQPDGWSGTFINGDGETVTVENGLITDVV